MLSFNLNKNEADGFHALHPKSFYQDKFGTPEVYYNSEYAYYKRSLFKKIEAKYPNATRHTSKKSINANTHILEDEVMYVDDATKTIVAINLYWDIDDYLLDDNDITDGDDYSLEEDIIENGPKRIRITKSSKFQAKISLLSKFDEPELQKFFAKIVSLEKKAKMGPRRMSIITQGIGGLDMMTFSTKKVDLNIEDNYNDDFKDVSDTIVKRLNTPGDNGIVLFHSEPGCGKTTYLRYLTQKTTKRVIYLPPDMVNKLADPDFMSFLMGYPNSILFIEDAENCLQKRDQGGNQAVSNLLNNSDGLLGDALRLQIVCTFNCDLRNIDPALMREGRLIAEYKFEKLSKQKTWALIKKLYGDDSEFLRDAGEKTLAEIYNLGSKRIATQPKSSPSIGFNRH